MTTAVGAGVGSAAEVGTTSIAGAGRVIEIRPHQVDLRVNGRIVRSVWRANPSITLEALRRTVDDPRWLRLSSPGTYELGAALYQAPDTHLSIAAPQVRKLLMLNQPAPWATWIRGSRASATFSNVAVLGWQASTRGPAKPSALRPYLAYTNDSRVVVTGSTFSSLGRPGHDTSGVSLLQGSSGSVTGSRFQRNQQGLTLDSPRRVTLSGVVASGSAGTGLVLKGGSGVRLHHVTSSRNGADGVELSHDGKRNSISDLTSYRNGRSGLAVRDQQDLRLAAVRVAINTNAGVDVRMSQRVKITAVRANREQRALYVGAGTSSLALSGSTVIGGATGVHIDAGAKQVSLRDTTVTGVTDVGFDLAGTGVSVASSRVDRAKVGLQLRDQTNGAQVSRFQATAVSTGLAVKALANDIRLDQVSVNGARDRALAIGGSRVQVTDLHAVNAATGVDIYGKASSVVLTAPRIEGADVGIAATRSTSGIQLHSARVVQQTGTGVSSSSPGLVVTGGTLHGARTALDLHADAIVTGVDVAASANAVRVGQESDVELLQSSLLSTGQGVRVADGSHAVLSNSTVTGTPGLTGAVTLQGRNSIPPPPTPWLGIAAASAIGSAAVLELLRRLREHEADRRVLAPVHVVRPS